MLEKQEYLESYIPIHERGPVVFEEQPEARRIVEVVAEHGIEIAVPIAQCSRV